MCDSAPYDLPLHGVPSIWLILPDWRASLLRGFGTLCECTGGGAAFGRIPLGFFRLARKMHHRAKHRTQATVSKPYSR